MLACSRQPKCVHESDKAGEAASDKAWASQCRCVAPGAVMCGQSVGTHIPDKAGLWKRMLVTHLLSKIVQMPEQTAYILDTLNRARTTT